MPRIVKCCVLNCADTKSVRHRFPIKEKDVFEIWKERAQHPRFDKITNEHIYKVYMMCDAHFRLDDKIPHSKKLKKRVLPTINIPGLDETVKMIEDAASKDEFTIGDDADEVSLRGAENETPVKWKADNFLPESADERTAKKPKLSYENNKTQETSIHHESGLDETVKMIEDAASKDEFTIGDDADEVSLRGTENETPVKWKADNFLPESADKRTAKKPKLSSEYNETQETLIHHESGLDETVKMIEDAASKDEFTIRDDADEVSLRGAENETPVKWKADNFLPESVDKRTAKKPKLSSINNETQETLIHHESGIVLKYTDGILWCGIRL